jgi:hypothetical protein
MKNLKIMMKSKLIKDEKEKFDLYHHNKNVINLDFSDPSSKTEDDDIDPNINKSAIQENKY